MDALGIRLGAGLVVFEPNPASRELIDRSLDVLDHEVQDRERCRCVVGLRVDPDPRPRSEVDLQTCWHVGAFHSQGRIDHLKPQGRAVELRAGSPDAGRAQERAQPVILIEAGAEDPAEVLTGGRLAGGPWATITVPGEPFASLV